MAEVKSPVAYTDLDYIPGEIILPGLCDVMYFVSRGDIATWPTRDLATPTGRGKYVGNFVLSEGKKFRILRATYDGGELTWEDQGTRPGKTILNKLAVPYPKNDQAALDNIAGMINDDVVVIFKDRQGFFRVMGAENFPSEVKNSGGSGKGVTGEGGSKFEISATDVCPCPIYEGQIDTEGGMVNAPEAA